MVGHPTKLIMSSSTKYEIVQVPNLAAFQEKLSTKTNAYSHILCLHEHKKVNSFSVHPRSSMDMIYRNDVSGDSFKITLEFLTVDFSLDVKRGNKCCWKSTLDDVGVDHVASEHDVQLFGITIADLIKCYYKCSSAKSSGSGAKISGGKKDRKKSSRSSTTSTTSGEEGKDDEKENILVDNHIKKGATRVEVKTKNLNNVLGMCVDNLIYPWDNFVGITSVGATHSKQDFTTFCSKYLFFPSSILLNAPVRGSYLYSRVLDDATVSEKKCLKFFETLAPKNLVSNLVRHFLFNENLNGSPDLNKTFVYDPPQKLIDILLNFSKDDANKNKFLEVYKKITGHTNRREEKELLEKYTEWTFDSCMQIPETYPIWALRNVYLRSWSHAHMNRISCHDGYPRKVKLSKFKYKRNVAVKERHQDVEWGCQGRGCCRMPSDHKTKELGMKSSMVVDDDDHYYDGVDSSGDSVSTNDDSPRPTLPTPTTLLDYFPAFIRGKEEKEEKL